MSINATTGVYSVTAMSADTGTATLRAVVGSVTLDKLYTISKSKAGVDGADGANGKVLRFTANSLVFKVPASGAITPSSITFTATGQNLAGSPTISVTAGTATLTGSGTTRVLASASLATETATISCTWDGLSEAVTVTKVRDGSTGAAGQGNIFPYVLAENFSLSPTTARASIIFNSDGTISRATGVGGTPVVVGNWYLPTTAGIGSSHWLRVTLQAGDTPGALNTWRQIATTQSAALATSNGELRATLGFQVAEDSSGDTIMGYGTGEIHVLADT